MEILQDERRFREKPINDACTMDKSRTRDFLEVFRVMKVQGFDPNDSNEWFKEERTTKLQQLCRKSILMIVGITCC